MFIDVWVFISIVLVGTIISFFKSLHWGFGFDRADFGFGIFASFVVGFLVLLLFVPIAPQFSQRPEAVESHPLVAVANSAEVSGTFFLFAGSVGENDIYTYMYETEDGGRIMDEVSVARVALYETDEEPRIEKVEDCTDLNFLHKCNPEIYPSYRLYVPKGSIWYGYDVDVRNG